MRKYMAFLKVIECGSFTIAADELNYTQSAVSQMISALEKELKTTLFIRSKFGLQLTKEGEQLKPYIYDLVDSYNNLNEKSSALSGLDSGIIRITTFGTLAGGFLPKVFKKFSEDYPNIIIETKQGHYREIEHWLNKDMVDFGITNINDVKGFEEVMLFEDPFYVILPAGHKYSDEEEIIPEQLKGEAFIALNEERDMEFLNVLRAVNVEPDIKCRLDDYNSIQAMIEQGIGISIMPKLAYLSGRFNIKAVPLKPTVIRNIGVIYKNKNQLSPSSRIFINYLCEEGKNFDKEE